MTRALPPILASALLAAACTSGKPAQAPVDLPDETTSEADIAGPEEKTTEAPAEPAGPTKEDLEKEMAPPDGLVDLRPIVGTDPAEPMPAIFAQVKKGMTAKDLDAIFPGVGAIPKIAFVTFTKQGNKWVRVKGNQKHKEVLDIAYDDDGGLKKIGYIFDPATIKPELWPYLTKSAELKWGETTSTGDYRRWPKEGLELTVHKSDDKTISIDVAF